ncbi:leucyl aminopeptidase [Hoeflea prorocentri]|uniref:Probable cytosol aminopeptidase n=1 Tax=Hoeflea prorocentri TaxID=1922333 RepID=A0A9X3UHE4_9HYPH|nr:leucyl aminopeptidase [Hoeflea prorocentri]MCY6381392.1 leucyl aminopeptidase [Hoeflea prorocentri]MDA5399192.1 leucyl aminopeptidase [Hoeflea prorocentri]
MSQKINITFSKSSAIKGGLAILLCRDEARLSPSAPSADPSGVATRAMEIAEFKGKKLSTLDVLVPEGSPADRLAILGIGDPADLEQRDWLRLGGAALGLAKKSPQITIFIDADEADITADAVSDFALGLLLRSYTFDAYKTRKNGNGEGNDKKSLSVILVSPNATAAKKAFQSAQAVAGGVTLARDLVNEPANILGPVEFAKKASALEKLGVEVEILTEKEMKKLGMGALLGVAQGSVRPPRLAIMQWKGGKAKQKPVAFIGKGVVFDTGGISLKPGAGMEDMKGDMGGAASVIGLMHALAARKAKANVIGIIGLVENMPDGNAQRPGDIVTSMSGQTIEVINTDAEGRLVLCDALWYCQHRFSPQCMINLATLTGAVIVALGHHHAGLFSNDDELCTQLTAAGHVTDEKVWRMPLAPEYDKLIDSKFADMKNVGGRWAGSITAGQFLQRFVNDVPWAHLDIAGTAMGSPQTEINRSWASGFGVRLLDEFIRANHEG